MINFFKNLLNRKVTKENVKESNLYFNLFYR